MSKELRSQFKEETGHESVFTSFGRIRPNWRYLHWLEAKAGQHEPIVMRKVYLEAKIDGLQEAITVIRNGIGSIYGRKPESLIEKKRKECFAKLRNLNDETA